MNAEGASDDIDADTLAWRTEVDTIAEDTAARVGDGTAEGAGSRDSSRHCVAASDRG